MQQKMYPCEIEGCTRLVAIRSKIKEGDYKGKKACGPCSQKLNPKKSPPVKKIKAFTEKTRKKNKDRSEIRVPYFEHHISKITRSEESGIRIPYPSRSNVCHLLPKQSHPSVQANLKNVVYLTLDEHTLFDGFFMTANFTKLETKFPNSWPIVCKRLLEIMPECKEKTNLFSKIERYLREKESHSS